MLTALEHIVNEEAADRARHQLIRTLSKFVDLSDRERQAVEGLTINIKMVAGNTAVVREGERSVVCCLLMDGLLHRYKDLPDGRRQTLSYHIPGDIPDLVSLHLDRMDHTLSAIVASRVALISHVSINDLIAAYPVLATAFWRETLIDAARSREWIVNVGARDAASRIGHLICELYVRLRSISLNVGDGFTLLMTQNEISEATGMSAVHVNRTLQELRTGGLIASEGRLLRILDWDGLQKRSSFDPSYLHMQRSGSEGSQASILV